MAELGLSEAESRHDQINSGKLKNTLAYVYAQQKLPQKEGVARMYASVALALNPESALRLDTMSFVQISYARTPEEVYEGIRLAERARSRGLPFEQYVKDVELATRKMSEIKATPTPAQSPA